VQVDVTENMEFYKAHGVNYLSRFRNGYDHHALAHALYAGQNEEVKQGLAAGLADVQPGDALISSEMLYHLDMVLPAIACVPPELVQNLHVIMYVRRQDEYLESLAKQYKKVGLLNGTMHEYIEANWKAGAYASFIENLLAAGPAVALTCRPYIASLLDGGDIISDFRRILDVPAPETPMAQNHWARNRAPCREFAEACGDFDFPSIQIRIRILNMVIRNEPGLLASDDILTPEERITLMQSFREENKRLSDFCGVDLDALFFRDVDFERANRAHKTPEESRRLKEHAEACLRREYQAFLEAEAR
jgi:hypothetical protein